MNEDVAALVEQQSKEVSELQTTDCMNACRALASIKRAADRICALEQGVRCDAARERAKEATKRVQAACPECATQTESPTQRPAEPAATAADAPPAEKAKGGCASCSMGAGDIDPSGLVFALLWLCARRRRPR